MALISKSCEYGLRATLYIAAHGDGGYVSIRELSRELDISFHFLTKILQKLSRHGILHSSRGPAGGVALARPVKSVSLLDVVQAIGDEELFSACVLGLKECGDSAPCPLHAQWSREKSRLLRMFRGTTIDKLAKPIANGTLRLGD